MVVLQVQTAFPECLEKFSRHRKLGVGLKQPFAWLLDTTALEVFEFRWLDHRMVVRLDRLGVAEEQRHPLGVPRLVNLVAAWVTWPRGLSLYHRVLLAVTLATATLGLLGLTEMSAYLMTLCHGISPDLG